MSEEDGMCYVYPAEFLQQLNAGGLSPALLCLKVGSSVILSRNLDPGKGLCNRTRMVVLNMRRKVLQYRIISKDRRFRDKVVLIPRIVKRICRYVFNDSKSAGLRPDRNDWS